MWYAIYQMKCGMLLVMLVECNKAHNDLIWRRIVQKYVSFRFLFGLPLPSSKLKAESAKLPQTKRCKALYW